LTGATGKRELPTREQALSYLRENGCDETVIKHCIAVSSLAVKIAKRCRADVELVEIGGLLHDLGRCKSHTLTHAVEGAKVAESLRLPAALVKIIERHIGAGILPDEAVSLGLPKKDYSPRTLEERIVAHADNLISGTKRTTVKEATAYLVRTGQQDVAHRILELHKDLSRTCGVDIDDIF
jgi:uncharacterized protein (TIGR00295 family)